MKNTKNIKNPNNDNLSIYNSSNYKLIIEPSIFDITNKFIYILIEYTNIFMDKIKLKTKQDLHFIYERGLNTVSHVFLNTLYYTKNLDLTNYYSQKSYYFYVEFIEQISDDSINFLKLSSRDAMIFAYKKTIYEINNESKKNIMEPTIDEKNKLELLNWHVRIYKSILLFLFIDNQSLNDKINSFKNIQEIIKAKALSSNQLECLLLFILILNQTKITYQQFEQTLIKFINHLYNKKNNNELKHKLLCEPELHIFIETNNVNALINKLF